MFYLTNSYVCVCFTKYIVLCSSDEICASLHLSPDQVQPEAHIIFQLQWTRFTSVLALGKTARMGFAVESLLSVCINIDTTEGNEPRVTENTNH